MTTRQMLLWSLAVLCLVARANDGAAQTKQAAPAEVRLDLYGDPLPPGALVRMGTLQFRHGSLMSSSPLIFSADGKRLISASAGDQTVRVFEVATGKQLHADKFPPSTHRYWPGLALTVNGLTAAADPTDGVFFRNVNLDKKWTKLPLDMQRPSSLSLSSDGRLLAVGSQGGVVAVWKIANGIKGIKPVTSFEHQGLAELHLSPNGKFVAVVANNSVSLWDVSATIEVQKFPTDVYTFGTATTAFSPDGKLLAVKSPRQPGLPPRSTVGVVIWDLTSGEKLREISNGEYYTLAFSPDSRYLAAPGAGQAICVWEVATGKEHRKLAHSGSSLTFSPDGRTLAYRFGAAIHLWDLMTDKQLQHRPGHQTDLQAVAISPNGKLLASADYRNAILWDTATGKQLHLLQGHEKQIHCLAFTSDGKTLVSASEHDHTIRRWDVTSGEEVSPLRIDDEVKKKASNEEVKKKVGKKKKDGDFARFGGTVVLSNDRRTLIFLRQGPKSREDRTIQGWDVDSGKELFHLPSTEDAILLELLSRDGKQTHPAGLRTILDRTGGFSRGVLPPALTSDGKIVAIPSSGVSGRIEGFTLWETATGLELIRIPSGGDEVAAFSPDGRRLLTIGVDAFQLWDIATGKRLFHQPAHESFGGRFGNTFASCFTFAPDGRSVATGLLDSTILIWDLSPNKWHAHLFAPSVRPDDLESLWSDLGGADGFKAHAALWTLAAAKPSLVEFLKKRLPPALDVDPKLIKRLIDDLSSDRFAVRDAAMRELRALGDATEPFLQAAVKQSPTLELTRRLESLLEALRLPQAGELLLRWRGVQVLEAVNSPEARAVLQELTRGAASARETREAQAALERLARRDAAR
jgi:WD40 repeat protein